MRCEIYPDYEIVNDLFFKQKPKDWSIFKLKFLIDSLESGKRKDFENTNFAFSIGGEHINWDGTLNLTNERIKVKEIDLIILKVGCKKMIVMISTYLIHHLIFKYFVKI